MRKWGGTWKRKIKWREFKWKGGLGKRRLKDWRGNSRLRSWKRKFRRIGRKLRIGRIKIVRESKRSIILRKSCWRPCHSVLKLILLPSNSSEISQCLSKCWWIVNPKKVKIFLMSKKEALKLKSWTKKQAMYIGGTLKNWQIDTIWLRTCHNNTSKQE